MIWTSSLRAVGKTTYFPLSAFAVDAFNIDDRCAQILGSYRAIPSNVRRAVAAECERFVLDHLNANESFAVETTLRTDVAIKQALLEDLRVRGIIEFRRSAVAPPPRP